jgi:hypothetical protein
VPAVLGAVATAALAGLLYVPVEERLFGLVIVLLLVAAVGLAAASLPLALLGGSAWASQQIESRPGSADA